MLINLINLVLCQLKQRFNLRI